MIGTRLGPYEITAKLGEGGMGVVYKAKDFHLGRDVALKVLPESLAQDSERLARFEREAKLLAQLNHPNIAQIHGLEIQGETRALVMELVEGPTLGERLEQGSLPFNESLSISLQIAQALEEAHEKGIVHRDLKPQNIKASNEGTVKVLDFGLAKAMDPSSGFGDSRELANSPTLTFGGTREGVILGTAAYMSPEQARGGAIDKRADIWAFGVVLYELFVGERLFGEGSVVDTLSAVMRKEIDLEKLHPTAPPRLRELLARCLERNPKNRLRDVGDARIVLQELLTGGPGKAAPIAERSEAPRLRRRFGVAVALAAFALGAFLAAVLVPRLRPVADAEAIRVHALTYSGGDIEPAASPDGKLVAFTSWRDGAPRIWIRQLVGGGEGPLTSGIDGLARFSPDGNSLLYVHDLGTKRAIERIGLVGGVPRRLVDDASSADWAPDGRRILFLRGATPGTVSSLVGVLDLESGKETILADEGNRIVHSPRWSPDGRHIAYSAGSFSGPDWQVRLIDVSTGAITDICPLADGYQIGGVAWSGRGESLFFVQSPSLMGDVSGTGSRVIRCDLASGARRTLFWSDGLVWTTSSASEITEVDVLAPGRLVFSRRLRRQNLREVQLGTERDGRILAEGSAIDRQPTYSPDSSKIFFSSNRGGNLDLWTLERSNGSLRQVTDDGAQDWDPSYFDDGRQIVWSSDRVHGNLEIWIAQADGSGARQVTRDGVSAQNPTATRDGKWIVYWSGNPAHLGIWKVRPDGSEATHLLKGLAINCEVSPDGRFVLYIDQGRQTLRNTIRFLEVASGQPVPFEIVVPFQLSGQPLIWGRARWSRDGRTIYFIGQNDKGISGVYAQEFTPGRGTASSRREIAGFSRDYVTESLGLSTDGKLLSISTLQGEASILIAENVPGALPPVRQAP